MVHTTPQQSCRGGQSKVELAGCRVGCCDTQDVLGCTFDLVNQRTTLRNPLAKPHAIAYDECASYYTHFLQGCGGRPLDSGGVLEAVPFVQFCGFPKDAAASGKPDSELVDTPGAFALDIQLRLKVVETCIEPRRSSRSAIHSGM